MAGEAPTNACGSRHHVLGNRSLDREFKSIGFVAENKVTEIPAATAQRLVQSFGNQVPKEGHDVQEGRLAAGVRADEHMKCPERLLHESEASVVQSLNL
jgi:hypothetical protein